MRAQLRVLQVAHGCDTISAKEIAAHIGCKHNTVRVLFQRALQLTGTHERYQVIALALRKEWIHSKW
jgi:DNA-binding CsgD family transcriptional regulator